MYTPTMLRPVMLLAITFCLTMGNAQNTAPATTETTTGAPACPSTATLDQLETAIDAAITGPANKDRTCFRQLFVPEARLAPLSATTSTPHILTVDDWITAVAKNGDEVVEEHQIKYQTESFGHIAHLWSTYTTLLAGKPRARGINSIQAVYDGKQWKVFEILWEAENATNQIPARYLP
jgi:hypothetical protein